MKVKMYYPVETVESKKGNENSKYNWVRRSKAEKANKDKE